MVAIPGRADDTEGSPAQQTRAVTAALVQDVAALRGLRPKRPIASQVVTREQIRARLVAELDSETGDDLAAEGRALARFGLIPAGADYLSLFVAASVEQIAGFYDPATQTLFVAEGIDLAPGPAGAPASDGRLVVAHEVAHALVDQHFGLQRFLAGASAAGGLDAEMARRALVEGDASATMVEIMFAASGLRPPWGDRVSMGRIAAALRGVEPPASTAPLWLRAHMAFPYVQGFDMVAEIRRTESWRSVDVRYRRPPLSSEHVLHADKYRAYEAPVPVAAPELPGAARVYDTVIGELGVRTLVEHHLGAASRADEVADGWGGDRFALYELAPAAVGQSAASKARPSRDVGVLMTQWDTEIDAIEFFAAAQSVAHSLCATIDSVPHDLVVRAVHVQGWSCTAERRGNRVLVTVGAPRGGAAAVTDALWAGWP